MRQKYMTIPIRIMPSCGGGFTHAKVDAEDYPLVSKWKWQQSRNGYAVRGQGNRTIYMHRFLMQTPDGMDTDHINRNKLDNRRSNLRITDRTNNNHNAPPSQNNTSGYRGVGYFKPAKLWRAYIKHKPTSPNRIELGYFKTKEEAIAARQEAERRLGVCG